MTSTDLSLRDHLDSSQSDESIEGDKAGYDLCMYAHIHMHEYSRHTGMLL